MGSGWWTVRDVTVLEYEAIEPGRLGRCSWETEQATRDAAVLAWIGRFRFVTAQAVARRFEISWQQANARLRRLERCGLIGFERQHVSQARAVFLTGRGHELLGWTRRKAPRAEVQREHEEAIVVLVTELERRRPDASVLTERECRQLEARAGFRVYSLSIRGTSRWPDAVVEAGDLREAFEIEFAPKGTDRLAGIVHAYEASDYVITTFLVKSAALGRRIARQTVELPETLRALRAPSEIRVVPWIGLGSDEQRSLAAKLGRELGS
jgi:DNA-binding MarR family transcriptional regulator